MRLVSVLWVSCLVALVACGDELGRASRVEDVRLLAVQADKPFALPGERVTLTTLAHDPSGRALSFAYGLCHRADSSLALDCLRTLSFEALTVEVGRTMFELEVPPGERRYLGVAVVVCPGQIVSALTAGIPVGCVDASGRALSLSEFEVGLKRLFARPSAENRNPALGAVLWDDAPWPEGERKQTQCLREGSEGCALFAAHSVELDTPDAAELGTDRAGLPLQEQVVHQFFATGGEFDDDVRSLDSPRNGFRARREDAGRVLTLWFVVRDDRGGVSFTTRELEVELL